MKKLLLSTIVATSLLASDTELQVLKAQMEQMSQMMRGMQEKITLLEKEKSASASTAAPKTLDTVVQTEASSKIVEKTTAIASLLNPSLIMDMSYVDRNIADEKIAHMGLPGIAHSLYGSHNHGGHEEAGYNAQNGFNLNYAELGFSGTVDPMFDATAIFHLSENGFEIEEAYFTTRELPYNLRLKGGEILE